MASNIRKALWRRAAVVHYGDKKTLLRIGDSTTYDIRMRYSIPPERPAVCGEDFVDINARIWKSVASHEKREPLVGGFVGLTVSLQVREATGELELMLYAGNYGEFCSKL